MERDTRHERGHWRGCHTFEDIVCDGDSINVGPSKRHGGLKMGQKYYYYYEVDGSTETYDPTVATTTACPFMPGQTVNTLEVPVEQTSRSRSASMTSVHTTDFKTMNPSDKFSSPRTAPPVPLARVGSSPSMPLNHKRSARSLSPTPSWKGAARRIFGLKSRDRNHTCDEEDDAPSIASSIMDETRSTTPFSNRSQDFTPDSLFRFLSEDGPLPTPAYEQPPKLWIPEEVIEETDDDDNFATSAVSEVSESVPFTLLSPPPLPRSFSSPSITAGKNESAVTIVPRASPQASNHDSPMTIRREFKIDIPQSRFSFSTTSSVTSPSSPTSPHSTDSQGLSNYSFFDESNDDDDDDVSNDEELFAFDKLRSNSNSVASNSYQPFSTYSLPHSTTTVQKHLTPTPSVGAPLASPAFVARTDSGEPVGNTGLLGRLDIDAGLDDLLSEISWMADVIQPKDI